MAGNLEFIKKETLTSTANNLQVTNCFSADYDVYKILMSKIDLSGLATLRMRLIKSDDSIDSTSNYDWATQVLRSYNSISEQRSTNQTYFQYISQQSASNFAGTGIEITMYNPFDSSSYTFFKDNSAGFLEAQGIFAPHGIGVNKVAQSITGFQMFLSNSDYEQLEVVVYGVK